MTISAYQVNNVLKAYNKQQKLPIRHLASFEGVAVPSDTVTLSANRHKADTNQKIAYTLLDLLKK